MNTYCKSHFFGGHEISWFSVKKKTTFSGALEFIDLKLFCMHGLVVYNFVDIHIPDYAPYNDFTEFH